MLKQDFLSKIIEQIVESIARILKIDHEKETEKFLNQMDEFLQTYFQISSENLEVLLEDNEKTNVFLTDEKLKNFNLNLFTKAGLAYLNQGKINRANTCLQIIRKIQNHPSNVFEFPSNESRTIEFLIEELQQKLDGTYFNESNQ